MPVPIPRPVSDLRTVIARRGDVDGLRRAAEIAIVVLLAVQAARLAWLLLPPAPLGMPAPGATPKVGVAMERLAIDAFHPAHAPAAATDTSGLRLFAVRPAEAGGSAILALGDAPQRSHAVGEEVAAGVTLVEVQDDHVVLDSSGRRSELHFAAPDGSRPRRVAKRAAPAAARPASAATAGGPPAAIDPVQLIAQMGLRPEQVDGRTSGYAVIPRGDGDVLRQAGLQAGDVLLSVNGEALDPERYATLAETLARVSTITFTYRRDGQIRSATLQAQTP